MPIDVERLRAALRTRRFGRELIYAEVMESTNERAATELARGDLLAHGAVVLADRQTRGKATAGKTWLSDDPGGLWHSLVLRDPLRVQPLSFLPAVALVDVLAAVGVEAHLKWPNDVLVGARKIAGILVESQPMPDGAHAWVVGVGLNVNQTAFDPEIAGVAISARMVTDRELAREELIAAYLQRAEAMYDAGEDLVAAWRARTRMLGRRIRAVRRGEPVVRTVVDLTPAGHLVVERDDGAREEWVSATDLDIDVRY